LLYLVSEARAPRAENAALLIEHDVLPDLDRLALVDLRVQRHAAPLAVVVHVILLQLALARRVADRAVDRVVQQEELQDGLLGRLRLLAGRVDDHALGHARVARDLELRRLLDLDEAHPAVAGDGEARVAGVVRDLDAGLVGRLDHGVAVGDLDLPAVDIKRGHAYGAPARRA